MQHIAIIGGGFCGTITAAQLVNKATEPLRITLINKTFDTGKGVAYQPFSKKHLLNVPTGKMSAFPDATDHFLEFVMHQTEFASVDRAVLATSFMPRYLYGLYLAEIWENTKTEANTKKIELTTLHSEAIALACTAHGYQITLANGASVVADKCVLATGNLLPRNPKIAHPQFYDSPYYFKNPWNVNSVTNIQSTLPVLIIGNGLTMVDTVLGLYENGYRGEVIALSPNGFNILPHRHGGLAYTQLREELREGMSLFEVYKLVHKHIKIVRQFGLSAEPVIDSLRPLTPKLWQSFSAADKQLFMRRFRHLWGVARHRIPMQIHDKIQKLRIEGKLKIYSGKLIDLHDKGEHAQVLFADRKTGETISMEISRVINCTGPETDLRLTTGLLHDLYEDGILTQDALHLGIEAHAASFQVINRKAHIQNGLYTLGGNLKGIFWESTAVPELRVQTEQLAAELLKRKAGFRPCSS